MFTESIPWQNTTITKPPSGYTFLALGHGELADCCKELSRKKGANINVVSVSSAHFKREMDLAAFFRDYDSRSGPRYHRDAETLSRRNQELSRHQIPQRSLTTCIALATTLGLRSLTKPALCWAIAFTMADFYATQQEMFLLGVRAHLAAGHSVLAQTTQPAKTPQELGRP